MKDLCITCKNFENCPVIESRHDGYLGEVIECENYDKL